MEIAKRSALEKRIKRRITARRHRFFAACSPGLKQLCLDEIEALSSAPDHNLYNNPDHNKDHNQDNCREPSGSDPVSGSQENKTGDRAEITQSSITSIDEIATIAGGIEFSGTIEDCLAANLHLRSPSRIIMRIGSFKAENFRSYEKKLGDIEWDLYLRPENEVRFEVSARGCRLYHKDALAVRARESVDAYLSFAERGSGTNEESGYGDRIQTVMVRGENDAFEISLDSSGDLLHKRGVKEHVGAAPIRETTAFRILDAMDYSPGRPLIDGMCGSGTFSIEAAMISANIPPGFFRKFAFEGWPCFSRGQWDHMKKVAQKEFGAPSGAPLIYSVDTDGALLEHFAGCVERVGISPWIEIVKSDFFDTVPEKLFDLSSIEKNCDSSSFMKEQSGGRPRGFIRLAKVRRAEKNRRKDSPPDGFVVLNPPYGKRLGDRNSTLKLYSDIGKKLRSDYRGWRAGVVVPDRKLLDLLPKVSSIIPIFHGGLEISAAVMNIR